MLAVGGAHFYVPGPNGIAAFARNADTGKLTQLPGADGCIVAAPATDVATCDNTGRAMEGTFGLAQSLNGGHVYAAVGISACRWPCSRATARPESSPSSPARRGASSTPPPPTSPPATTRARASRALQFPLASSDGKHVYVAGFGDATTDGNVAAFSINANGTLTQLAAPNDCVTDSADGCGATGTGLAGAAGLALSADDRLYVAGLDDDAIAAFSRQPASGSNRAARRTQRLLRRGPRRVRQRRAGSRRSPRSGAQPGRTVPVLDSHQRRRGGHVRARGGARLHCGRSVGAEPARA